MSKLTEKLVLDPSNQFRAKYATFLCVCKLAVQMAREVGVHETGSGKQIMNGSSSGGIVCVNRLGFLDDCDTGRQTSALHFFSSLHIHTIQTILHCITYFNVIKG